MNQLSYYVTKRLIVGSKDSSGTIIQTEVINEWEWINEWGSKWSEVKSNELIERMERARKERKWLTEGNEVTTRSAAMGCVKWIQLN